MNDDALKVDNHTKQMEQQEAQLLQRLQLTYNREKLVMNKLNNQQMKSPLRVSKRGGLSQTID